MMFDEVKIYVRSGSGGDGLVAFRREKFVPRGGPAGGDGGQGGDVVLVVDPRLNTLASFQNKSQFRAQDGGKGGTSNKTGASAPALEVPVPPGTIVRDAHTEAMVADLVRAGDRMVIAQGGRGGRGNARFKSSANQAPRIAEKGEPGQERWLALELRLIADVGIVGVPNAGKSTLLSVLSNARPKIADYPFTTLEPNLGVVLLDDREMVFADIPGLIEGAHMGIGLGHAFLRHVQRTRVLVHLLDGTSADPIADFNQINVELSLYDEHLAEKPQLVAFSKMDLPEAQQAWSSVRQRLATRGIEAMAISSATGDNVRALAQRVVALVDALPAYEAPAVVDDAAVYGLPHEEPLFTITRDDDGAFHVRGRRIERAAAMTYWDSEDTMMRFQRILEALGISAALEQAGVVPGDTVFIGDYELEWTE